MNSRSTVTKLDSNLNLPKHGFTGYGTHNFGIADFDNFVVKAPTKRTGSSDTQLKWEPQNYNIQGIGNNKL